MAPSELAMKPLPTPLDVSIRTTLGPALSATWATVRSLEDEDDWVDLLLFDPLVVGVLLFEEVEVEAAGVDDGEVASETVCSALPEQAAPPMMAIAARPPMMAFRVLRVCGRFMTAFPF